MSEQRGPVSTAMSMATSASTDTVFGNATILVVDDHPANVAVLEGVLARAGARRVHTVTDAREAVDVYQSVAPDLVLLDLHMPGLNGFEIMEAFDSKRDPDEFVPVIVLTADSTAATRERALVAGATDFLTKPFDRVEVVLRARNLLHARALHQRLGKHNAALRAEVELGRRTKERARTERQAIVERITAVTQSDALRMVFQPIAELQSRAVVAYEALARFECEPRRTPDVWFAEAAGTGLGVELELAAVRRALRVLPALVADVALTLNVSPQAAVDPTLDALLREHPGERVVLEITEHAAVDDYDHLLAGLQPLRDRGTRVAVDDAGAGFASLSHILRLRPDVIKLDISLVRDIDDDPVKRALAASLVGFAREMGSTIVAEGIETSGELRALVDLGVPWGQGWHLGRPGDVGTAATDNS